MTKLEPVQTGLGQVGQNRAAPQREGLPQQLGGALVVAAPRRRTPLGGELLEPEQVDVLGRYDEVLTRRLGDEVRVGQGAAEAPDRVVKHLFAVADIVFAGQSALMSSEVATTRSRFSARHPSVTFNSVSGCLIYQAKGPNPIFGTSGNC